jgi:hypothetical protein
MQFLQSSALVLCGLCLCGGSSLAAEARGSAGNGGAQRGGGGTQKRAEPHKAPSPFQTPQNQNATSGINIQPLKTSAGSSGANAFSGGKISISSGKGVAPAGGGLHSSVGKNNAQAGNSGKALGGSAGAATGVSKDDLLRIEEQMLNRRLSEAHRLRELAKNTGDRNLATQANQMAKRAEEQFGKQRSRLKQGTPNNPTAASGGGQAKR